MFYVLFSMFVFVIWWFDYFRPFRLIMICVKFYQLLLGVLLGWQFFPKNGIFYLGLLGTRTSEHKVWWDNVGRDLSLQENEPSVI